MFLEKIKKLSTLQKVMSFVYLIAILLSLIFYAIEVDNPNNYKTTISCQGEIITYDYKVDDDDEFEKVCPTAFVRQDHIVYPVINFTTY